MSDSMLIIKGVITEIPAAAASEFIISVLCRGGYAGLICYFTAFIWYVPSDFQNFVYVCYFPPTSVFTAVSAKKASALPV